MVTRTENTATTTKFPAELLALLAYAWWGFVPLYWKFLDAFSSSELILFRILLSAVSLLPILLWKKQMGSVVQLLKNPRTFLGLALSGVLVGFNWYLYIWAVNHGHVVESSLGYFLNPLVNMLLGFLFLKEVMTPAQRLAGAFAAFGVCILIWHTGHLPWIALALAISFGLYGFMRKILAVPTMPGTFLETVLLAAPAAIGFYLLAKDSQLHCLSASMPELLVLSLVGLMTTIPLLAFAEAAKHLTLSVMGFFQFLSPTFQFLLGVFVFREPFDFVQWCSFAFIWMGLVIFFVGSTQRFFLREKP